MSKKNKNYFGGNNIEEEIKSEDIVEEDVQKEDEDEIVYDPQETSEVEESAQNEELDIEEVEETEEDSIPVSIGTVNCSKLNVREYPNITARINTILNYNDTVKVIDDTDTDFYKITYGIDYEAIGYVKKEFINL